MQEMLTLNRREQRRLQILNEVEGGGLNMREAAEMMVLSLRQVRRLRGVYRIEGAEGLAHGNRGQRSPDGHMLSERGWYRLAFRERNGSGG